MRSFFLLCTVCLCTIGLRAQMPNPIPDVPLLKLDSVTVIQSKDIVPSGKVTMLIIWNSMMRPAFAELDSLQKRYPEWQKKYGVEMVTVASQYSPQLDNLNKFLKKRNYTFPIYRESDRKFANALRVNAMPATFFIDKKGVIVDKITGYSPGDEVKIEAKINELAKQ